jgi:predicted site-specific integrase-resolvase
MTKKGDRYLKPEQLADTMQVEVPIIEGWAKAGWIRSVKLPSGELRLDPRSVQDFLRACELDVRLHFVDVVT